MSLNDPIWAPRKKRASIYYFLGHLPAQMLHGFYLYKQLPGTCVVLSEEAKRYCDHHQLNSILLDRHDVGYRPFRFRGKKDYTRFSFSEIPNTVTHLNQQSGVIFFFDTYPEIDRLTTLKKIMLFHGNSLKLSWFRPWRVRCLKKYDFLTTLGPFWESLLKKKGVPEIKFLRIGQTRCDSFLQASIVNEQKKDTIKRLKIDRPLVSYMPTWYGSTSVVDLGFRILKELSDEYFLAVCPHPETPSSIIQKLYNIIKSRKHISLIHPQHETRVSLLDLLCASDVFIMDRSSVLIDALLRDVPIVFALRGSPLEVMWGNRYYRPLEKLFQLSPKLTRNSIKHLNYIVKSALDSPVKKDIAGAVKKRFFYNLDGHATDCLFSFIHQLMGPL